MYKICHTEASCLRQRELERGLLSLLQELPYEKITLTGLCRRLAVPRKSFYRYFPTRDDCLLALIDHTLADCNTVALTGWDGDREVKQTHLQRFFTYWQEQRDFLGILRSNKLQSLLLDRTTVFVDSLKEKDQSADSARNQVEYFIAHGLMTVVLRWHDSGFRSTPEELAAVFSQLLHSPEVSMDRLML